METSGMSKEKLLAQAEALEWAAKQDRPHEIYMRSVKLRALAAQAGEAEPVAWRWRFHAEDWLYENVREAMNTPELYRVPFDGQVA